MSDIFFELTLVVVVAALFGVVARLLRQPTIVAYIAGGVALVGFGLLAPENHDVLETMGTLGVTLLLFLVGLQMRFDNLVAVGRAALLGGIGQIVFTTSVGFGIVTLMGYDWLTALYMSFALAFSSTIIVVKLLNEKRDTQSLYGRIVVGFLIVQDVVAILLLIVLAGFQGGNESANAWSFVGTVAKSIFILGLVYYLSQKVFPWIFSRLARTSELVFVISIAWALGFSSLIASQWIGLSIEIGGFLAGIALARSLEQFQIEAQLRPLRDFFLLLFFVSLGSLLVIDNISVSLAPALILSLFVLIGNPIIMLIIMGALGYRRKTNFFSSVTVAQISEFSLILMAMGLTLGHVTDSEVSLVTLVAIITITISTYMILYSQVLFRKLAPFLKIFERKHVVEESIQSINIKGPIILVGAHRLGKHLLQTITKQKLVIVEFDPYIVRKLQKEKFKVIFGDITDPEIQEVVHMSEAYIIVSTIPNIEDNILLLNAVNEQKQKTGHSPKIIVTAYTVWEAHHLYQIGADYVVLPHFLGGKHLASLLKNGRIDEKMMQGWRRHDERVIEEQEAEQVA